MLKNRWLFLLLSFVFLSCNFQAVFAIQDQNNLLALLKPDAAPQAKSVPVKVGPQSLLQALQAQQNNVDFQAALKILNDVKVKELYQQTLNSMQLGFLQYSLRVLEKYKKTVLPSKPNLLVLIKPVPSVPDAKAANLLDLLQPQATASMPVKKDNLLQLITTAAPAVQATPKETSLLPLLADQNAQHVTSVPQNSSANLLQLLSPKG